MHFCYKELLIIMALLNPITYVVARHYLCRAKSFFGKE